ncbi:uncharacterized protein METZ01_LOCUS129699, partial [marine metagenome]
VLFAEHLCVIRGGGDLGTGVALCLSRAGFPVAVCELADPLTVRRAVALSSAVTRGEVTVEGLTARRVNDAGEVSDLAATGVVPVLVDHGLPRVSQSVVVDARMAKRPLDTRPDDAPFVVALGPGFSAGKDCHAVVETLRGSHMGRVLWEGSTEPDTGTPAPVGGRTADRVLRAPVDGTIGWDRRIGDLVEAGEVLGRVGNREVAAPFDGLIRGLILNGIKVTSGTKVGDVDPRGKTASAHEVSDKALAVGGGVLEAVLTWLNRTG